LIFVDAFNPNNRDPFFEFLSKNVLELLEVVKNANENFWYQPILLNLFIWVLWHCNQLILVK